MVALQIRLKTGVGVDDFKIYTNDYQSLKHLRLTMAMNCEDELKRKELLEKGINPMFSEELLTIYEEYLVAIFNNQFTVEDLERGFKSELLYKTIQDISNAVYPKLKSNGEVESGKK